MSDEDVVIDDAVPIFESIPTDFAAPRSVRIGRPSDVQVSPLEDVSVEADEVSQPKRRGRPKGSKNRPKDGFSLPELNTGVKDKLGKELSVKTQMILKGTTAIPSIWRPHFQMTDVEAQNIADPLAAYLVRQAEINPAIEAFVENFDVAAFVVGTSGYVVRVVKDDIEYRRANPTHQSSTRRSGNPTQSFAPSNGVVPAAEDSPPSVESGIDDGEGYKPISTPSFRQD